MPLRCNVVGDSFKHLVEIKAQLAEVRRAKITKIKEVKAMKKNCVEVKCKKEEE